MTTITLPRATVEQALEALKYFRDTAICSADTDVANEVIPDLEAALAQQAEPVEPVAWLRVIDEAMVTHHLGVADPGDDYETAKRKMNNLLCMAQDIGTYFAKQAEPVEPVAWMDDSGHPKHIRHLQSVTERRLYGPLRPLYTSPPQRKPLTEEEIDKVSRRWVPVAAYMGLREHAEMTQEQAQQSMRKFARAVERAHGIPMPEAPTCPDCHGIGYDASGQTCGCQP